MTTKNEPANNNPTPPQQQAEKPADDGALEGGGFKVRKPKPSVEQPST